MCKITICVFSLICYSSFSSGAYLHDKIKRADIDLQTCIDKFDIHKDKIIRTEDSRQMGAKYLNEIDLGSREECLRLCCETDNCDVFVFEDKNAGSCYLFHCGPPEDFKCKFTHHVNYSSAVLSVNRHLPDLESQIKLTKHEQDLSKLRKPESDPEMIGPIVQIVTHPSVPTTTKKEEITSIPEVKIVESGKKCSRYQFECRSTKECIAIYNACNGIPQCADGSDEAPELGCPETTTISLPVMQNNQPPPPPQDINRRPLAELPDSKLYGPQSGVAMEFGVPLRTANIQEFPKAATDPRIAPPSRAQFNTASQYNQLIPEQTPWIHHQSNQMPVPIAPTYGDKSSRIFNHKENGLQVLSDGEISQTQYNNDDVNGREFAKVPNYYENDFRQPVQDPSWPINTKGSPQYNNQYGHDVNANSKNNWGEENSDHVQRKMAHDLKHSKSNMDHGNLIENPKIVIEKFQHTQTAQANQYPDVTAYKLSGTADLEDGIAEVPGGAILSLTLGLIITCIMAILIGCRLQVVRKRMRKGGKAYAHDADYLVNGMYL